MLVFLWRWRNDTYSTGGGKAEFPFNASHLGNLHKLKTYYIATSLERTSLQRNSRYNGKKVVPKILPIETHS